MAAYDPGNVFAKILRGEMPCHRIFEDEAALAFMDIMPRADGHALVIPKVEARGILDMPPDALGPYMQRVQRVAAAVQRGMGSEGLTLQQFNEAAGGQVVFHLHFHILPRWTGVALRPPASFKEDDAVLADQAARMAAAMKRRGYDPELVLSCRCDCSAPSRASGNPATDNALPCLQNLLGSRVRADERRFVQGPSTTTSNANCAVQAHAQWSSLPLAGTPRATRFNFWASNTARS